jgi:hypothetical protein
LLKIFFTEEGAVGFYYREEAVKYFGDTAKVTWAEAALESVLQFSERRFGNGRAGGVHFSRIGQEYRLAAGGGKQRQVFSRAARIQAQVFRIVELPGVDEYGSHRQASGIAGGLQKCEVAFVQGTHGRNESDGAIRPKLFYCRIQRPAIEKNLQFGK